ncbi:uncharacterized protein LOC117331245 [Pecten maximus]|uniref:uncharacterized protein LOC117331245 n=1 Tax=Pecten maximus TaxID=6579 RepID=UPI00145814A2|nr:uncharacterized protein LOC117331245 [Pecten maximus]
MCYYKTNFYDHFEKSQIYKTTHKYCGRDCCRSNNQVTCCTKTNENEDDNDITGDPVGWMTFGAVFGSLIGVIFGLSVCILVGCHIKKLCFRPIAKLEPKKGKPEHHRAAKYLATLNKGKEKANQKKKHPPPRRSRLARRHNEATNFAFDEAEYAEELDFTASPTTDYFYDDISDGPSPSPILYNNFEKGGMRIVVSPSCIDFHNLGDDDEVFCEKKDPQRSVSIDCGQVDHTVNRRESVVGISADASMRHASIC